MFSMRDPKTLVLEGDDDRTVVDRRRDPTSREATRLPFEWKTFFRRWGSPLCVTVAVAVCCGLCGWIYHERRNANGLRSAIEELERACLPRTKSSTAKGSAQEILEGFDVATDPPSFGTTRVNRAKLESRGARLLAENNYRAALPYYQVLAGHYPEERVFSDVLAVLHAKLRCESRKGKARFQCE